MAALFKPSCVKCSRYLSCKDKLKNTRGHSCVEFKRLREIHDVSELEHIALVPKGEDEDLVKPLKRAKIIVPAEPEIEVADNFVLQAMERAYDPNTNLVRDLKIDDGDLPLAQNFYDYCARLAGKNVKMPFSRQLWIGLTLCGEICPDCTNPKAQEMWNVPVDLDPHDLAASMSLLEYGVCPDCKKTKYDFIKEGTLKDYSELVLVGGQRMGKCCTGDTLALTTKGLLTFDQLEELHADSRGTYGFVPYKGPSLVDEHGRPRKPSHFYREQPAPLLTVTLDNGMVETGTPNHPVWTLNGWVALKDLSEGDVVPIKVGQDVWSTSKVRLADYHARAQAKFDQSIKQLKSIHAVPYPKGYVDETVATFLGYFIAEGYSGEGEGLSVTNQDLAVLEACEAALLQLFPEATVVKKDRSYGSSNRKVVSFFDVLLDDMLTKRSRSADVYVPSCILKSPKSVVVAFLRALYEGDGGVNGQRVDYTTLSPHLAQQIQILLANLGIHTWIFKRKSWASNGSPTQISKDYFTVAIAGEEDLRRFESRIGFTSSRKQAMLADELAQRQAKTKPMPSYNDRLPEHVQLAWYNVIDEVKDALSQHTAPDSFGRPRTLTLASVLGSRKGRRRQGVGLTRNSVARTYLSLKSSPHYKLLTADQKSRLSSLASLASNYDLGWTTVKSVTRATSQPTYDVSIPKGHRFMANGILNHNSTFTASLVAYCTHRLFKAPKLSTISRGIQDFTPLTASFVALTATKAQKLLWNPVRDLIGASEWFTDYFKMLDHFGKKYGKEFYQFNSTGTYLRAFHKNLDMYPEGPSKRTLRGPTRWLCLAKGTLVNTDKGLVPIEDTKPGVHRANVGNVWSDVLKTASTGFKKCVTACTASGLELTLTPDHRVLTYDIDTSDLVWSKIKDVPLGGYLVRSVPDADCIEDSAEPFQFASTIQPHKDWGHDSKFNWLEEKYHSQSKFTLAEFAEAFGPNAFRGKFKQLRLCGALLRHPKQGDDVPHLMEVQSLDKLHAFKRKYQASPLTSIRLNYTLPNELTRELARVIGYLIADGNYALWGSTEVTFGTKSKARLTDYYNCLTALVGHKVVHKRHNSVIFSFDTIKEFFISIGIEPTNSRNKKLPDPILTAPSDLLIECLSTMVSCDGGIQSSVTGQPNVGLSTTSKTLANQVQLCFARLGFVSRIRKATKILAADRITYLRGHKTARARVFKKKGTAVTTYRVVLDPLDSARFMEVYTGKAKRNHSVSVKAVKRTLRVTARTSVSRHLPGQYPIVNASWSSSVALTESSLNNLRVVVPSKVEHNLVDRGIVLDRLVSIEDAGAHEVYDIEIDNSLHAFTAQGIVVHNCATDELGHFPYSTTAGDEDEEEDERERANGDEVHQVLTNSLATVRTEVGSMYARGIFTVPQGFNLSISSPASFKDKIMRLYRETQDSDLALGVKAATWEISPLYSRDHPIIQDMYRRNPRKAERDFGANPPSLDSSIFNKELVLPLFQEDRVLSIVYVDHHEKTRAKAVVVKEQATLHPAILALDAGLTNNAFALSLTYKDQTTGLVTGRSSLEIVPQPGKKIDFPYVYENVIKVIIATQNVKWVFADRWNSIHILQQIETDFPGVKATQYSLKAKDFANFIEVVGDRKISLGALEIEVDRIEAVIDYKKELKNYPNAHLFLQFLTVQLQGGMLYKGGSNTDDLMRALVLGVSRQYDAKVSEHMAKFKVQDREGVSTNAVVLVSGRSGLGYFNR